MPTDFFFSNHSQTLVLFQNWAPTYSANVVTGTIFGICHFFCHSINIFCNFKTGITFEHKQDITLNSILNLHSFHYHENTDSRLQFYTSNHSHECVSTKHRNREQAVYSYIISISNITQRTTAYAGMKKIQSLYHYSMKWLCSNKMRTRTQKMFCPPTVELRVQHFLLHLHITCALTTSSHPTNTSTQHS